MAQLLGRQGMNSAIKFMCVLAAVVWSVASSEAVSAESKSERINAGAVAVVADQLGSQSLNYAADLADVLGHENDLRILPIAGHGPVEAIRDVIYLRGIDGAIVPSDVLAYMKKQQMLEDLDENLAYLARFGSPQLHVIARKDIGSLGDLAGRRVNIGSAAEARFVTGSLVFETLGLKIEPRDGNELDALQQLRDGEVDAIVLVAEQPSPIAAELAKDGRFKLLSVAIDDELGKTYLPSMLDDKSYAGLLDGQGGLETLSMSYVFAVFNAEKGTERYNKFKKLADVLFASIGDLQSGRRYANWGHVNMSASVPGWARYATAEEWLAQKRKKPEKPDPADVSALREQFRSLQDGGGSTVGEAAIRARFEKWRESQLQ
jgi:uncharacterized protein